MNEYTFKHIEANDCENAKALASMHHLRWKVFHQELNWTAGLVNRNCLEFDDYDRPYAHYIVRVNQQDEVDACCRLIPTDKPYMLDECYSNFIQNGEIPHSPETWEISRLAASQEARKQTKGSIMAHLIVGMIEFGIKNEIKNYLSLTTAHLVPIIKRMGWDSQPLGEKKETPDDQSYSLRQTVSFEMLDRVKERNNIQGHILYDLAETRSNILGVLPYGQEIIPPAARNGYKPGELKGPS